MGYPMPTYQTRTSNTSDQTSGPSPLAQEAFYGIPGSIVQAIAPRTEADTVALLLHFLVAFGNLIGRTAYFRVDGAVHYLNLFAVFVGKTSKGRKGTAWARIHNDVFKKVFCAWLLRIQSGLSSGEGLIWAIRDPVEGTDKKGKPIIIDPGVEDKRLLVVESEFASVLKVCARDGSTLSPVLRLAWDGTTLQILNKNSPAFATDPHVSILGHITESELRRYLTATDQANGFGNRILWTLVKRSQLLPEGGGSEIPGLQELNDLLPILANHANDIGELCFDDKARKLWHAEYAVLSSDQHGLFGALTARAEAQVMRIACIYAVLEGSSVIELDHLRAALAIWRYCEESVRCIFGNTLGDSLADEIFVQLRKRNAGMTRTDISNYLGRNRRADEIGRALTVLQENAMARARIEGTVGRSVERWFAEVTGA